MLVLGTIGWSIIFSIGRGSPVFYLPFPDGAMPAWALEYSSNPMVWIGGIIGWAILCFVPGLPLFVVLKRYSKRFREFVVS